MMRAFGSNASLELGCDRSASYLHQVEIKEVVDIGYLNGLFVLARSIGLIGAASTSSACVRDAAAAVKQRLMRLVLLPLLALAAHCHRGCRPCLGSKAAPTAAVPTSLG